MTCHVRGCRRPVKTRGLCHNHYEYRRRHGLIPLQSDLRSGLIEDLEWLVSTGETHVEAIVSRLGQANPRALERKLRRAGRADLLAQVTGFHTNAVRKPVV